MIPLNDTVSSESLRILYDSRYPEYKTPTGCLRPHESCHISVGVPNSCRLRKGALILEREDGLSLTVPLTAKKEQGAYQFWDASFSLFAEGLYFYTFRMETDQSTFTLYRWGAGDTNMEDGEPWQVSCLPADYHTPKAPAGCVMYQIFPDRFAKAGEPDLSSKLTPFWLHKSPDEPPVKGPNKEGNWNCDFYGGNLRGIEEKLPYLKSLGVELLYLNPIFLAASNHRYDTADYKKLDPMLGTEEDFISLCHTAKAQGIRILLDGVFSHVGADSRYFDAKHRFGGGAISAPDSPYRSWFTFKQYPDDYDCWWEVKSLPCVKEMEPTFLDYIIRDEDSVVAHWIRLGADGFRLDVADELPDEFIALLRKRVKELNPEALVIGEVWEDASHKCSYGKRRQYFTAGELDGVMNYPFREAILSLIMGKITPQAFADTVLTLVDHYPKDAIHTCMTFLSTHDTPRVRTVLQNALGDCANRAMKAAIALQYALPGMPCIYYGDEAGMEGGADPDNRQFFRSGMEAEAFTSHYRTMGELRKNSQALRRGEISFLTEASKLTVIRQYQTERICFTLLFDGTYDFSFQKT